MEAKGREPRGPLRANPSFSCKAVGTDDNGGAWALGAGFQLTGVQRCCGFAAHRLQGPAAVPGLGRTWNAENRAAALGGWADSPRPGPRPQTPQAFGTRYRLGTA